MGGLLLFGSCRAGRDLVLALRHVIAQGQEAVGEMNILNYRRTVRLSEFKVGEVPDRVNAAPGKSGGNGDRRLLGYGEHRHIDLVFGKEFFQIIHAEMGNAGQKAYLNFIDNKGAIK